jgi:hypothetical protein
MPPRTSTRRSKVTGYLIAQTAEQYADDGYGYVYGGECNYAGDWDCSSFASWVLGKRLGMAIPGGRWGGPGLPPGNHGPDVADYIAWTGATQVGTPQVGDLVCFAPNTHMGIVTGDNEMVSAQSPAAGTGKSAILGLGLGDVVYLRVNGVPGGAAIGGLAAMPAGAGGGSPLLAILVAGGVLALGAIALAVLSVAGAAGVGWAVHRTLGDWGAS